MFQLETDSPPSPLDKVMKELNKVFHSAPNQELRDFMKQYIGKYLETTKKLCSSVLGTLSSGDTGKMKETAEQLKVHSNTIENIKRKQAELMTRFGVDKQV